MAFIDDRPNCKDPRCRNRAEKGGYCDDHKTDRNERHKEYNDFKRDPAKVKVYNSQRWKKLRTRIIDSNPLCTRCEPNGKLTPANLVDHLVGFVDENDPHAWDPDYLFPLCTRCHAIVTAKERYTNFLKMPLVEAVFLKYDGAIPRDYDHTIRI